MIHTRNSRKAMGAAAPDLDQLTDRKATRPKKGRKPSIHDADGGAASKYRAGSEGLDLPGAFAPSPFNIGNRAEEGGSPDEIEKARAEAHISIAMGECTDEDESCHPEECTDDDHESELCPETERMGEQPCPEERTIVNDLGRTMYPNPHTMGRTRRPASFVFDDVSPHGTGNAQSTTPFHATGRRARVPDRTPSFRLDGPKFFSPDVIECENVYSIDYVHELEQDQRSDETLKQKTTPKRKSEAHQRAEDIAFLNAIINDRKRLRHLKAILPDIIPNEKSLLAEIQEALRDSSDGEQILSEWEIEPEDLPESPITGPSFQTRTVSPTNQPSTSEPSEYNGPSYFAKGKWVSDEVHDARKSYKAAKVAETAPTHQNEGRETRTAKPKAKRKARPSIGITIDKIKPPKPTPRAAEKASKPDLGASVTALPAGGYFAEKMRARTLGNESTTASVPSKPTRKHTTTPGDSDSSSSSSDTESSSTNSSPCSSISTSRKRRNAKKREDYRKKNRKLKRKIRKARRTKVQIIEPAPYNGQADYDEFEIWDYEVDQWLDDSGYKGRKAIRYIKQFLKGKAARWYMDYIAPNPQDYTVDAVKIGLFAYFFPPNMKTKLRNEFKFAEQGDKRFIDYLQELKRLQRRIPDITDRQMCIKLWDSVHAYIKVKWVEAGLDAEEAELSALTESAEQFEAAEAVKRQIQTHKERYRGTQDSQRAPKSPEANHLRCYMSESEYSADKTSASDEETDTSSSADTESQDTDPDRTANKQPEIFSAAVQLDYDCLKESDMTQGAHIASQSSVKPQDTARTILEPLVAKTTINGHRVRALVDTGSLGDFMSETIVDKLKLERNTLAKPIGLQMVVAGCRSSIYYSVTVEFGYQGIRDARRFNVINISDYDLILGMPFLYQHQVLLGVNPPTILIGSSYPLTLPPSDQFHVADALEAEPKLQAEMHHRLSHTAIRKAKGTPMIKDRIPGQGAHRQLKAKTARQSNEDPRSRRNRGDKSEKKPNASNNAEKALLPTRSTHSILAPTVLPVTDVQALPTHSTQSNQPDKAPGPLTPHGEPHIPAGQQPLPTPNPPANGPQGEKQANNHEEDYTMQAAEAVH